MSRDLTELPFTEEEQRKLRKALNELADKAVWLTGSSTDRSDIRVRDLNDLYDMYMIVQRIVFFPPLND